ncbi:MAG TPA: archaellin/type IV pilin N-terminal domain-containing protein [Candidatus Thermoplasmatota archaeon]|nr:archaellin/type IV pilin N-terminal domain-containing protein [Candidatus Thermoplasmatota archaeon]
MPPHHRDDRAEVGVGTLIVFIAMVLVAALAAGVLIGTSGKLQERAQATGREATAEVGSNLRVDTIYGIRAAPGGVLSSTIDNLTLHVSLAAGAIPVDLADTILRYSDGTTVRELTYSSTMTYADAATNFDLTVIRDADGSFSAANPTIDSSDLVKVNVYDVALGPSEAIQMTLFPGIGARVPADFTSPHSFGVEKDIRVR